MNSFPPESETISALLKIQIGPVQEFISQARSTRDLWSGSYLLSWLVAKGILHLLQQHGAEMIFPHPKRQPLLMQPPPDDQPQKLLTPNLSNIIVAVLPGKTAEAAAAAAKEAAQAMRDEWANIARAVWAERHALHLRDDETGRARFDAQVAHHLAISWQVTPLPQAAGDPAGDYQEAYRRNGWQLDAVRQTRAFAAWAAGGWELTAEEKDSLSGREEAVAGGKEWRESLASPYSHLFKHNDHLGAVNLIKRVWHLAYLNGIPPFGAVVQKFKIRSTRAIAAREDVDDDDENVELKTGEKYLAAIAFDGDAIGQWLDGSLLPPGMPLRKFHEEFSRCLSAFALEDARCIVEDQHQGLLIYAGGDDVVALVPADVALACAQALRTAFRAATSSITGEARDEVTKQPRQRQPDASAGIAVAHFKFPLQDLIREAQAAERRAKNDLGRSAFAITLLKRSGETEKWGAQWESRGLALHEAVSQALADGWLSTRFPHRVAELLAPYLNAGDEKHRRKDVPGFQAHEVIRLEFSHALERQGRKGDGTALLQGLDDYLSHLPAQPQAALRAVVGLCQTVAFTHRNRGPAAPAARAAFETATTTTTPLSPAP